MQRTKIGVIKYKAVIDVKTHAQLQISDGFDSKVYENVPVIWQELVTQSLQTAPYQLKTHFRVWFMSHIKEPTFLIVLHLASSLWEIRLASVGRRCFRPFLRICSLLVLRRNRPVCWRNRLLTCRKLPGTQEKYNIKQGKKFHKRWITKGINFGNTSCADVIPI